MIKIIHYCWFGRNPKSTLVMTCIKSWRMYFPDWEIKEWNEENFDVHCNLYVSQAYKAKKWAFVSDYCRFWVLEHYGGLYFDTDVEVIRSFEPLITNEAFAGFETDQYVNPGLVLFTASPNNPIISECREYYDQACFLDEYGKRIRINVCRIFTAILLNHGFVPNGQQQKCDSIIIYPVDYFCPYDDATGLLHLSEDTYAIHWYEKSWMSKGRIIRNRCMRLVHRYFGTDIRRKVEKLIGKR